MILETMARTVWVLSTRSAILFCFAMMMVAAPIAVHAEEPTKHFDIKAQPLAEAPRIIMSYAIIGFGKLGHALAKSFARKGIEVSVWPGDL